MAKKKSVKSAAAAAAAVEVTASTSVNNPTVTEASSVVGVKRQRTDSANSDTSLVGRQEKTGSPKTNSSPPASASSAKNPKKKRKIKGTYSVHVKIAQIYFQVQDFGEFNNQITLNWLSRDALAVMLT